MDVADANLALALVIPLPYSLPARELFEAWNESGKDIVVPALWGYEIVSGLRKSVVLGVLTPDEADSALQHIWELEAEQVPANLDRYQRAMKWAELLDQTVAYDAQYLVIAEEHGVPFWTADKKVTKKAKAIGVDWVHWIGISE